MSENPMVPFTLTERMGYEPKDSRFISLLPTQEIIVARLP